MAAVLVPRNIRSSSSFFRDISEVQMNPSNPITKGVAVWFPFGGGDGLAGNAVLPASFQGEANKRARDPLFPGAYTAYDGVAGLTRVDDSITSTHPLNLSGAAYVGWSFWMRWDATNQSDAFPRIIDKSDGGSMANGWGIYLVEHGSTPNTWSMFVTVDGATTIQSSYNIPTDNEWHHYFVRHYPSGPSTLNKVAIDGVSSTLVTDLGSTIPSDTTNCSIASWNHSTGRELLADIFDLRVYNDVMQFTLIEDYIDPVKSMEFWKLRGPRQYWFIGRGAAVDTIDETDSVAIGEDVSTAAIYNRSQSDNIALADAVTIAMVRAVSAADNVAIATADPDVQNPAAANFPVFINRQTLASCSYAAVQVQQ